MDNNQADNFKAFKASITRIYNGNGAVIGAGFLVSSQYVLTCAHVITQALSLPQNTKEMPSGSIDIDFPLIAPGNKLQAQVNFWQPVSSTELVEDIAGLISNKLIVTEIYLFEGLCKNPHTTPSMVRRMSR